MNTLSTRGTCAREAATPGKNAHPAAIAHFIVDVRADVSAHFIFHLILVIPLAKSLSSLSPIGTTLRDQESSANRHPPSEIRIRVFRERVKSIQRLESPLRGHRLKAGNLAYNPATGAGQNATGFLPCVS